MISAISFMLLILGALFAFISGSLHEEGNKGSALASALLGGLLLLMSWGLA